MNEFTNTTTSAARADHIIEWLRAYAPRRINSRLMDERRAIFPNVVLDFGNRGLFGLQVPQRYGGQDLTTYDAARVIQQLGAIDLTLGLFVGNHIALGTRPIHNFAPDALREAWLPAIARGRELAAFALTEPEAGSNPLAITATATPAGDGRWLLNGRKLWTGSGAWAGILNVFVRLLGENGRYRGMTGFAIPQGTAGLEMGPEALTMGMRGMVQNEIILNNVPVTTDNLLGRAGKGMRVAHDAMMLGRFGLGVMSVGGIKRCAQLMHRYATRRTISTGCLIDNSITRVRLSEAAAKITSLEAFVMLLAQMMDRGEDIPVEANMICKIAGPEFLFETADHTVQMLGGRGSVEPNIAPQILRDARLLRIFEGPTETLLSYLGARMVGNRTEFYRFIAETLNAPSIAAHLDEVVTEATETRGKTDSVSDHWLHYVVGELTVRATMWAAAVYASAQSEAAESAVLWAHQRYEVQADMICNHLYPAHRLNAFEIADHVYSYSETIGQLERTIAGEDHSVDALLRPDVVAPQKAYAPPVNRNLMRESN
ncbi:MAG: acyl-CoA dehydrogenase family protein [Chloroflexota bacterium]